MSVFKLPDGLLNEIQSHIAKFWWSNKGKHSKIHWIAWKKLRECKRLRGLRLRDMKTFNLALLSKQAWNLLTQPNSLLAKVYKCLYFQNSYFLNAAFTSKASYSWRSILAGRDVLMKGLKCHIGNGKAVRIFKDRWLMGSNPRKLYLSFNRQGSNLDMESKVESLIDSVSKGRDHEKISSSFADDDAHEILKVPLGDQMLDDVPVWPFTKNVYRRKSVWKKLWRLNIAGKAANATLINERSVLVQKSWSPPPENCLKINVDATVGQNERSAIGLVVRDSTGSFVAAKSINMANVGDIEVLEAMAIKEAGKWIIEKNYTNVMIESDALAVVKMFDLKLENRSIAGLFVKETKMLLKDRSWKFGWTPREANKVAHRIAASAKDFISLSIN